MKFDRDLLLELLHTNMGEPPGYGRGTDDRAQDIDGFYLDDYPEAYAYAGRAAHLLGDATVANVCADWLTSHRDGGPHRWGLPYDWALYNDRRRLIPAHTGFVPTTVACLHLLADLGRPVDDGWLIEYGAWYGDHPKAHVEIWNAQAQAAGYLARTGSHPDTVQQLAGNVVANQSNDGLWPYSPHMPYRFEYHQAMILEGLTLAHTPGALDQTFVALQRGLNATWEWLFEDTGEPHTSPERSAPWPAHHLALMAWTFHANHHDERADLVAGWLYDNYLTDEGKVLQVPGGDSNIRPALGAVCHLARMLP